MPDYTNPYPHLIPNGLWKLLTLFLDANSVSGPIFVSDGYYILRDVRAVQRVASTSGTLQIEHRLSGVAAGSGTNQLTATLSLSSTANTPTRATVISEPTIVAPGDMLGKVIAGTMTSLADCVVSLYLERLRKGEF
jgi:hypothetical protein